MSGPMDRMNGPAVKPRAHLRPMQGWWRRDPFFIRYMVREATALAVLAYALVLTAGLVCLALGEVAFSAWLAALRSPASLLLHAVLLAGFVVHAHSWFEIMPKTMAPLHWRGQRVAPRTITRLGWTAAVSCSLLVLALAWFASR